MWVENGVKVNCRVLQDAFFKQRYKKNSASFKKAEVFMQNGAPSHLFRFSTAQR